MGYRHSRGLPIALLSSLIAIAGCGRIGYSALDPRDGGEQHDAGADALVDSGTDAGANCSSPPCLDPSFALARINLGDGASAPFYIQGLDRHRDGYVVLGRVPGPIDSDVLITRIDDSGRVDDSFGANGRVILDQGTDQHPHSVLVGSGDLIYASFAGEGIAYAARVLPNGTPDTTFGSVGIAIANPNPRENLANGIGLDSDGSVYIGGQGYFPGGVIDLVASKLTPDGMVDTSFGVNGSFHQDINSDEFGGLLRLQNGNLVLFGSSWTGPEHFNCAFQLVSSDGALVPPFGPALPGRSYDIGGAEDRCGVGIEGPGNTVLATGFARTTTLDHIVLRLNASDLTLDTGFGTGGVVLRDFAGDDAGQAIGVFSDGRIVVGGDQNWDTVAEPTLWVLEADGSESVAPFVISAGIAGSSRSVRSLIVDELNRVTVMMVEQAIDGDNLVLVRYLF